MDFFALQYDNILRQADLSKATGEKLACRSAQANPEIPYRFFIINYIGSQKIPISRLLTV